MIASDQRREFLRAISKRMDTTYTRESPVTKHCQRWRSSAGVVVCAAVSAMLPLALSACTTQNYSPAIRTFSDATTDAHAALTSLNETVTREYEALLTDRILAVPGSNLERVQQECRATSSARCRLEILSADNTANEKLFPPEPILNDLVELMARIASYARNLKALANGQSATEVETSVNAAMGSIQSLANTLATSPGESTTVAEFGTPVASAVYWLIGKYVQNVKLSGLRHATKKANPVIQQAVRYFSSASSLASLVPGTRLSEALNTELNALGDNGPTQVEIDRAVAAAATFDAFLRADPNAVFAKLATAHDALHASLDGGDRSFVQVLVALDEFSKSAHELKKIVSDLTELRDS